MQITDIKIRKFFDEGPMKAIVSVTFDDALAVHDIKVIYARERYFIVMPSRRYLPRHRSSHQCRLPCRA